MKTAEIIERLPAESRDGLMAAHGLSAADCGLLGDAAFLKSVLERLSFAERLTLERIVKESAGLPLAAEGLAGRPPDGFSPAEAKTAVIRLLAKGVLFQLRKTWGETLYVIPEDAYPIWHGLLLGGVADADGEEGMSGVTVTVQARPCLQDDLMTLMRMAFEGELVLTRKGTLHRKAVKIMSGAFAVSEAAMREAGLSYAFRDVYPPHVAVVLDAALRQDLLRETDGKLAANPTAWEHFLTSTNEQARRKLAEWWREAAMPEEMWLRHAVLVLERLPAGRWLPVARVLTWLAERGLLPEGADAAALGERLVKRWLRPLCELGAAELGEAAFGEEGMAFRWAMVRDVPEAQEPPSRRGLVIQPDFEVLALPEAPLRARWLLARMAECLQRDVVSRYRLTRERFCRALEQGLEAEKAVAELEAASVRGMPSAVRDALLGWSRDYGRVYCEEAVLLRCDSARLADEIAGHPRLGPFLIERLGERVFAVRNAKEALAELDRSGFAPRGQVVKRDGEADDRTDPDDGADVGSRTGEGPGRGLLHSPANVRLYKLESRVPAVEDLYPQLRELPAMWLKENRRYHGSTRREMLRKAIELEAYVRLKRNGRWSRFVPTGLDERGGEWTVRGYGDGHPCRLSPGDWEEMQLILPGINDK